MNLQERQQAYEEWCEETKKIMAGKGHDYTAGRGEEDANANFYMVAELLEGAPITPYTVGMIYALKHLFSLLTFCKTGKQESGEGLLGRHHDLANYMFILSLLVDDHAPSVENLEIVFRYQEQK